MTWASKGRSEAVYFSSYEPEYVTYNLFPMCKVEPLLPIGKETVAWQSCSIWGTIKSSQLPLDLQLLLVKRPQLMNAWVWVLGLVSQNLLIHNPLSFDLPTSTAFNSRLWGHREKSPQNAGQIESFAIWKITQSLYHYCVRNPPEQLSNHTAAPVDPIPVWQKWSHIN